MIHPAARPRLRQPWLPHRCYRGTERRRPRPAPIPGNLAALAELDNVDKHRIVQTVWRAPDLFSGAEREPTTDELGLCIKMTMAGPLREGMEIGRFSFVDEPPPVPEWFEPGRYFPLHMSMREPYFITGTLLLLRSFITVVEIVLDMFEPCIQDGDEPKPLRYWQQQSASP